MLGVFSSIMDFGVAVAFGVFMFFVSGAIYRLTDEHQLLEEKIRDTITILLSGIGTVIIILSVFGSIKNLEFGVGLVLGLTFYFLAGITNNYLSNVYKNRNPFANATGFSDDKEVHINKNGEIVKTKHFRLKCKKCGFQIKNTDHYCYNCGLKLQN